MKQLKPTLYGFAILAANRKSFRGPTSQGGATAIEYALIAALIAVGIIAGATLVGDEIAALFEDDIAPALTGAGE